MMFSSFFFFNDTATTEIYTLSLHDALPISAGGAGLPRTARGGTVTPGRRQVPGHRLCVAPVEKADRKSTRLNSSHGYISYAVFCLKKKKRLAPPKDNPDFASINCQTG